MAKLRGLYPEMAAHPEMLHSVALQQTCLLQHYRSSGGANAGKGDGKCKDAEANSTQENNDCKGSGKVWGEEETKQVDTEKSRTDVCSGKRSEIAAIEQRSVKPCSDKQTEGHSKVSESSGMLQQESLQPWCGKKSETMEQSPVEPAGSTKPKHPLVPSPAAAQFLRNVPQSQLAMPQRVTPSHAMPGQRVMPLMDVTPGQRFTPPMHDQRVVSPQEMPGQKSMPLLPMPGQRVMPSNPMSGPRVIPSQPLTGQRVNQQQSMSGQRVMQPHAMPGQRAMPLQSLPGQRVNAQQSLPGQRVVPSQALPGQRVLPPKSMPGQRVGPSQSMPGQRITNPMPESEAFTMNSEENWNDEIDDYTTGFRLKQQEPQTLRGPELNRECAPGTRYHPTRPEPFPTSDYYDHVQYAKDKEGFKTDLKNRETWPPVRSEPPETEETYRSSTEKDGNQGEERNVKNSE